ncbi:uroporphyrinogen-III synthase [Roseomonas sp. OT10]|uniref:uroporphyrinogen-III synthase n=1 Tax=Roseomonas cutis TaxID=2897332 RepID=UPI001E3279DB|nr:uroporphyrinogen-III synthase [Roseomonas sp. OT10]
MLAPALRLDARTVPLPAAQAVLLTSRAAARALAGRWPAAPVLAVGEASAAEARAAGAGMVAAAGGTADSLAALAASRLDPAQGPLLLAAGEGYARDLAEALRHRGFRVLRRVVYAAGPARHLPEPARDALAQGQVGAALFFSPRSAEVALRLWREAGVAAAATAVVALALSARVASALQDLPWRDLRVASRPDQDALLALLGPAGQEGSLPVP